MWAFFLELHTARQSSGHGPQPLAYGDIAAWSTLTHRDLTPLEVELLKELDAEYLMHARRVAAPADAKQVTPARDDSDDEDEDDDDDEGSPA